jgi:hypothetical protein
MVLGDKELSGEVRYTRNTRRSNDRFRGMMEFCF